MYPFSPPPSSGVDPKPKKYRLFHAILAMIELNISLFYWAESAYRFGKLYDREYLNSEKSFEQVKERGRLYYCHRQKQSMVS